MPRLISCFCIFLFALAINPINTSHAQTASALEVYPNRELQTFDGMGCGSIFYSGHIASFSKRKKHELQSKFYDELFTDVRTDFLHVMIRPDFEPENDNDDPYLVEFEEADFEKNRDLQHVCQAAKERRPEMKIYATLYTPPALSLIHI